MKNPGFPGGGSVAALSGKSAQGVPLGHSTPVLGLELATTTPLELLGVEGVLADAWSTERRG
jgi:hypothetical protein